MYDGDNVNDNDKINDNDNGLQTLHYNVNENDNPMEFTIYY